MLSGMHETIASAWTNAVTEDGDRNVLVFDDSPITYAALDREADAVAAGLLARGRKHGDRIGLIGLNRPEWLVVYLAAAKLGLVVVALSVRYRENELLHMLAQSEACMLVAPRTAGDLEYEGYLAALRPGRPRSRRSSCSTETRLPSAHRSTTPRSRPPPPR